MTKKSTKQFSRDCNATKKIFVRFVVLCVLCDQKINQAILKRLQHYHKKVFVSAVPSLCAL
jgi:hypothetical protein